MKKFGKWVTLAVGCIALPAVAALAAQAQQASSGQPNSLQQLLQQVQADLQQQTKQDEARIHKFLQAKDHQQALLNQAKEELAHQNALSKKLQSNFDANEKKLSNLTSTLHAREGNMGEVFGIVRQTAGEFKSTLDNSIISAQYPNRSQFAAKMAASHALPSIHDLKKLWYEMLQEMTQQGQVSKYKTQVTLTNGSHVDKDVVRVGAFNTVMGSQYLNYLPETGALVVLARQPAGRFTSSAGHLYRTSSGMAGFGIDPLRGQLLSLFIQKPTFPQRIQEGGPIGDSILVIFGIAILFVLERLIMLSITNGKIRKQLKSDKPNKNNALGRVLAVYDESRSDDVETLTLKLDEAIMKEVPTLEARQGIIQLVAAIGPLLGLLGTVVGMIETFTSITLFGTGNPAYMAHGISTALVTTVEGLITAIPLVALHGYIQSRSRKLVQILEEQAAGIIASQAEKANRQ